MYKRSLKNDLEGNLRLHWLLVDSLEVYFKINRLWYFGPKRSLEWLKLNNIDAYEVFKNALTKNAEMVDIEKSVEMINCLK